MLPVLPDRLTLFGQGRESTQFSPGLSRLMKVRAAGRDKLFLLADNGQISGGVGHLLAGHHFHSLATCSDKIVKQCDQFGAGEVILNRVRQYRCPSRIPDPRHYLRHIGPALLYIARLTGPEVFFEGLPEIADGANVHQVLGKMGATQIVVAGDGSGSRQCIAKSCLLQFLGNTLGSQSAGMLLKPDTGLQSLTVDVDIETQNMYPGFVPLAGKFQSWNYLDGLNPAGTQLLPGGNTVVVGNRQHIDACLRCQVHQFGG
jgi:hypothetical protein